MINYALFGVLMWLLIAPQALAQQAGTTADNRIEGANARGFGAHRSWLPWVSVNHLHGITGLEELDRALYQRLAKGD